MRDVLAGRRGGISRAVEPCPVELTEAFASAVAVTVLIVSPAVYLLVPLMMPLDLMPHGLRKAVASTVTTVGGRDLLKHMLADFENAVEHAAKEAKDAAKREKARRPRGPRVGVAGGPPNGGPARHHAATPGTRT